jgi:hypothetical protein
VQTGHLEGMSSVIYTLSLGRPHEAYAPVSRVRTRVTASGNFVFIAALMQHIRPLAQPRPDAQSPPVPDSCGGRIIADDVGISSGVPSLIGGVALE